MPADPYRRLRAAVRAAAPGLARDLPWVGADPWPVLVSEVMLQQTPAARVAEPWARFLELFPTPRALAEAPLAGALVAWTGLGYPRRARDLRAAAAIIVARHGGEVPSDPAALRALPGVGAYTAAAVAVFAFGARVTPIDTNVGRVLARAAANRRLGARDAAEVAARLLPRDGAPSFAQALIDLGARHCRSAPR
ncbi:MAG TPA: A/G-specific adenine glycosylase, partial [Acidimicrobiales bacterium]|nr:A/G-specific adenine glycosylase [Acidimicrobiales bacterium]